MNPPQDLDALIQSGELDVDIDRVGARIVREDAELMAEFQRALLEDFEMVLSIARAARESSEKAGAVVAPTPEEIVARRKFVRRATERSTAARIARVNAQAENREL
jgi:hypothetical protein